MDMFDGIWIPLVTPFKGTAVDHAALRRLVQHLAAQGVAGFAACGSTGEAAMLGEDEQAAVLATTAFSALAADTKDPVEARKAIFKDYKKVFGQGMGAVMKGEKPYNKDEFAKLAEQMVERHAHVVVPHVGVVAGAGEEGGEGGEIGRAHV